MFRQRIITAAILIAIVLSLLFFLPPPFFFLVTFFVALVCAWEWSHLMQVKTTIRRLFYVGCVGAVLFGALFLVPVFFILFCALIGWVFFTFLIIFYPSGREWWRHRFLWRGLMGLWVCIPPVIALNFIRVQVHGINLILFLFILIWGADSAAYFVGKKWGKNKLAPRVSPGKTIEGLGGALGFSILWAIFILSIFHMPLPFWFGSIMLSFITVLVSVIGDLFESMHKREACLKDSGCLFPGHGGLLDRVDSLTAAAPIFTLGLILLS